MGFSTKKCDGCGQDYDFSKYASMNCSTHHKDHCWECPDIFKSCVALEGKCNLIGITNPQWVVNLRIKNET